MCHEKFVQEEKKSADNFYLYIMVKLGLINAFLILQLGVVVEGLNYFPLPRNKSNIH